MSALLGPALGGVLTETLSWRGIFWVNLLPGLPSAFLVATLLPGAVGQGSRRRAGWATPRLLRDRTQQAINASGLALGAALLGVVGYLPVQVQAVGGGGALDAGLALIPMSVSWTVAANVAGRVVGRFGFRSLVRVGTGLTAAGAVVAAVSTAHPLGLVLFGAGMGFTISSFNVAAQESAPRELRGSATSLSLFSRSIGGAVGAPAFGLLAGIRPGGGGDFHDVAGLEQGLARVFAAVAFCAALAALLVLRFPRARGR